jgi:hypothetical protein
MTETTGTGAGGSAQAVQSPRKSSWPPMRAPADILENLDKNCPSLDATHSVLRGPFSSADDAFDACTKWSRDGALQTGGTFRWFRANTRPPNRKRGFERTFACNGCIAAMVFSRWTFTYTSITKHADTNYVGAVRPCASFSYWHVSQWYPRGVVIKTSTA